MKSFLIVAIISGASYFGYQYLPADIKTRADSLLSGIGLSRLNPVNILPPLAASTQKVREAVTPPENPVKKREIIISKLEANLKALEQSPNSPAERLILKDSEALIADLREENPKSGAAANITERVANLVLPAKTEATAEICKKP